MLTKTLVALALAFAFTANASAAPKGQTNYQPQTEHSWMDRASKTVDGGGY